jgi:hypothetical protein
MLMQPCDDSLADKRVAGSAANGLAHRGAAAGRKLVKERWKLPVSRDLFALFPTSLHHINTNRNTKLEL